MGRSYPDARCGHRKNAEALSTTRSGRHLVSQAIQQIFETPIMLMRPYCVCEYLHVVELHVQFGWVHLELSSHSGSTKGPDPNSRNSKEKKNHSPTGNYFQVGSQVT
jgi:hypothetical protein